MSAPDERRQQVPDCWLKARDDGCYKGWPMCQGRQRTRRPNCGCGGAVARCTSHAARPSGWSIGWVAQGRPLYSYSQVVIVRAGAPPGCTCTKDWTVLTARDARLPSHHLSAQLAYFTSRPPA